MGKFLSKSLNLCFDLIIPFVKRFKKYVAIKEQAELKKKFKFFGSDGDIQPPHRILNPQYISIGNNFSSLYNLRLEAIDYYYSKRHFPDLVIGDNVIVHTDVHIGAINKIVIGNNVLIASRVYINDHSHGEINLDALNEIPANRLLISKGPVIIEDNVWIGEGVCILGGVTIGRNSIVGANSVVTKSFPCNCVIGGVPARLIKILE